MEKWNFLYEIFIFCYNMNEKVGRKWIQLKSLWIFEKIQKIWISFTLKQKIAYFAGTAVLIVAVSIVFNIAIADFALNGFNRILNDNAKSHDLQNAMELEQQDFKAYVRNKSEELKDRYVISSVRMERCIKGIPFDYETIGANRYAKIWSIKNAYATYCVQRASVLEMDPSQDSYVTELYRTYQMQEFLTEYTKQLMQITLREGNQSYQNRVPALYRIPYIIVILAVGMVGLILYLAWIMNQSLVRPIVRMAHVSRKIAINDFSDMDLAVDNRDEMGELVRAFNKMKHSTENYITTLEEKNRMAELLHREEMEKIEMEKRLSAIELELLKSQINPHFLFNTLNLIACTAKLERAESTEQMILCLSSLFRYNLKTPEAVVMLKQELKVVSDYMYIQKMRFGDRIRYEIDSKVDSSRVMIPAFALQPIVENAIIHGLAKKEEGGRIYMRIWEKDKRVTISIADTGVGITKERLSSLRRALKERGNNTVGIGVGNIYQRIYAMYEKGFFGIYSSEGKGTVVQMVIPQE